MRPGWLKTEPGYRAWMAAEFATFVGCDSVADSLKRAAALGHFTGQRKQDCPIMSKVARDGGAIEVVSEKAKNSSGIRLWIPEHPELTTVLDTTPATDATTLPPRFDGKPWKENHFNSAFAKTERAAGLLGLSFHGLRKANSA